LTDTNAANVVFPNNTMMRPVLGELITISFSPSPLRSPAFMMVGVELVRLGPSSIVKPSELFAGFRNTVEIGKEAFWGRPKITAIWFCCRSSTKPTNPKSSMPSPLTSPKEVTLEPNAALEESVPEAEILKPCTPSSNTEMFMIGLVVEFDKARLPKMTYMVECELSTIAKSVKPSLLTSPIVATAKLVRGVPDSWGTNTCVISGEEAPLDPREPSEISADQAPAWPETISMLPLWLMNKSSTPSPLTSP
jgi:hypothetical protein